MIIKNDALKIFELNMVRTNMLIQAIEKINSYNHLYQEKIIDISLEYRDIVKSIQDVELSKISKTCSEHAFISLTTAFESYLKELVQELLFKRSNYFLRNDTKWRNKLTSLINDSKSFNFEFILIELNLNNRFQILNFLKDFNIILLTINEENFIKALYIKRNNYVHNGSKLSQKTINQIKKLNNTDRMKYIELDIKGTRTIFQKMINDINNRIFQKTSHINATRTNS